MKKTVVCWKCNFTFWGDAYRTKFVCPSCNSTVDLMVSSKEAFAGAFEEGKQQGDCEQQQKEI